MSGVFIKNYASLGVLQWRDAAIADGDVRGTRPKGGCSTASRRAWVFEIYDILSAPATFKGHVHGDRPPLTGPIAMLVYR